MAKRIEVIYENNVLKPLIPIKGLKKNERAWVILCPRSKRESLHELVGTLSHEESKEMQKFIDEEFGTIEGEW